MTALTLTALRAIRTRVLRVADSVGLNRFLSASSWRKDRLLILCYHGVSIDDEHEWSDSYIEQEHLVRRLASLRKGGATLLALDEALGRLRSGDLPPCAVSVTFDDGTYDFHSRAMPVLVSNRVPTMLYLTTFYCGRNQPVFDPVVSYLLWKARGQHLKIPGVDVSVTIPHSTRDERFVDIYNEIQRYTIQAGLDANEKHELVRRLAVTVGQDFDSLLERRMFQIMSPAEVTSLCPSLVSVQLHTHRHRTPRDELLFRREVEDNRTAIESIRGASTPLNHFCYPSGDYVDRYADWLRAAGIEWATTCDSGLVSTRSDPLFLPRFIDNGRVSETTFRAWVSGLSCLTFAQRSPVLNRPGT